MVVARDVVTITKEAAEMVNYREILRLSNDPKNGQRSIAAALHCSRDTIREVRVAAEKAGVSWPLDSTVTNEILTLMTEALFLRLLWTASSTMPMRF